MIRIRSGLNIRGEIDTNGYPIKNVGAPDDDADVATKGHVEQYAAPAALLGQPGGIALLDASGAVPVEQLPASLGGAAPAPVTSVAGRIGDITLVAADVGLSNVDNTSDVDKPVSTAQAAADTAARDRANHTGTQTAATISDFTAAADARITAQKGAASGLAPLGADSKIASNYLPAIAITSTYTVASQAAQLALTAQEGDVAIRTDLSQTFIHNGGSAASMADWTLLATPTDTVTSVAGRTGVVTLAAADVAGVETPAGAQSKADAAAAASIPLAQKAAASGVASLDATGKVPAGQSQVSTVAGRTGAVALTSADVGLGNVDNTSDVNKPVSTAQAAADTAAKARANHTGTQTASTISDFDAAADARITAQKGAASGLAPLGSDSKIPSTYLPAIAITSTYTVASQAAQLALTAQEGDVAIRSDLSQTFVNNGGTAGTMADWTLLATPTDLVSSVAGRTGVVVLSKSDVGLGNVDNTSDASKPVSTAQAAADALKVSKTGDSMSGKLTVANATAGQPILDLSSSSATGSGIWVALNATALTQPAVSIYGTGDTNDRLRFEGTGKLIWGPGNASGDTNLYRPTNTPDTLKTDDSFIATNVTANTNLYVGVQGDTWLYRNGSGILKTDGQFRAVGDITTFGNLVFGNIGDTYLYRGAASVLKTDNTLNLGVATAETTAKLDVAGSVSTYLGANLRFYSNVASYYTGSTVTGTMKIAMPKSWSSTYMRVAIRGVDASAGLGGAWEVVVGAYNWASGPSWMRTSVELRGNPPFSTVRLGHDGTNCVILLGNTATSWAGASSIVVAEVQAAFSNVTGWGSGWTIGAITDETGIGSIVTPTLYGLGNAVGPAGTPGLVFSDVNLYRASADVLRTDDAMSINRANTGDPALAVLVSGDAANRLVIEASGKMVWGTGGTTGDVTLSRNGAGILNVGTNVSIGAAGPSGFPGLVLTDANLYRNAADTLRTDDSLQVMGANGVSTDVVGGTGGAYLHLRPGGANSAVSELRLANTGTGASLTFMTEAGATDTTTLYRSAAGVLKTDGTLNAVGGVQVNGVGIGDWVAYTPTIGGTGWALGNGTLTAKYTKIGHTVHWWASIVWGTTSTFGTGQMSLALPVAATSGALYRFMGQSTGLRVGVNTYHFTVEYASAVSVIPVMVAANGAASVVTATAPVTWQSGDTFTFSGTYEAA